MPIAFTCQECGEAFKAPDQLAGKTIKCRKCSALVSIPISKAPARAPAKQGLPGAKPAPATPPKPLEPLLGSLPPLPASHLSAGAGYVPMPGPAAKPGRSVESRQRGPGPLQFVIMLAGTGVLLVTLAGSYATLSRAFAIVRPTTPVRTGMEGLEGLQQTRNLPGSVQPASTAAPTASDEDWDE